MRLNKEKFKVEELLKQVDGVGKKTNSIECYEDKKRKSGLVINGSPRAYPHAIPSSSSGL